MYYFVSSKKWYKHNQFDYPLSTRMLGQENVAPLVHVCVCLLSRYILYNVATIYVYASHLVYPKMIRLVYGTNNSTQSCVKLKKSYHSIPVHILTVIDM